MFSSRVRQSAGRNRIAMALDRRRAAGLPIVDLTLSNPTQAGLEYPGGLLDAMRHERSRRYEPEPFGLFSARQAVSDEIARRGVRVAPNRTVLTASTSEAYSLLLKLLCDPGDAVLSPRPSYPLVEHLTDLEGVSLEHYRLEHHRRWEPDLDDLRTRAGGSRMRAIVMINPNNPTGSTLSDAELDAVAAIACDRDLALISDEVFADYPICGQQPASALRQQQALTFMLGGLSKSVGLPQVKLGWIAVGGPDALASEALERLETICDAYLSVATPVQVAAPDLLSAGAVVRSRIHERVRGNYTRLTRIAAVNPACAVLPVEAGWYAIVQVPALATEETLVLDLLEGTGVLVHPGYFFDFEREAFLVLSLLPDPEMFAAAAETLFEFMDGRE
jgi:hypothetical protein